MIFLKIIFWLFIAEIIYIAFFQKEKLIRYKQLIKSNNGRKLYRIDYISSRRWR